MCVQKEGARAQFRNGDAEDLVKERLGKKPRGHRNVQHTRVKERTPKKAHTPWVKLELRRRFDMVRVAES